jgi:hypothetical protein
VSYDKSLTSRIRWFGGSCKATACAPAAPVPLTAQAVAELVGGRLVGNGARVLTAVGSLKGPTAKRFAACVGRYVAAFRPRVPEQCSSSRKT